MQDSKNKLIDRLRCHDEVILSWGTGETIRLKKTVRFTCSLCYWSAWTQRPKRAVICSISHAWEAREHPDPCGHQLPGRMPHALEYVIQNAIFIYFHAFAKQIYGLRPRYLKLPIIPVLTIFVFGIWVGSCWTLKAWYTRSVVSTPFFGALETL